MWRRKIYNVLKYQNNIIQFIVAANVEKYSQNDLPILSYARKIWSIVCNRAPAGTSVHKRPVGVLLLSLLDTKSASPAPYSTGLTYI